jgi:hypothetical protein
MYDSVILPIVCYEYKLCYFILIEAQVLENRGMEKILASEWAGHMMKLRKLT